MILLGRTGTGKTAILRSVYEKNNSKYLLYQENEIRNIIHSTQEEMISSALSMYTTPYKNILKACDVVLHSRNYYFQEKELVDKLKEAVVAANSVDCDTEDVKRILLKVVLLEKSMILTINI